MTPQEVIAADCERTGHRIGAVMHGVMAAMDKGGRVFHDNKSVVVLEPMGESKKDYKAHLFTIDASLGLVRSVQKIIAQIMEVPSLKRVYGNAKDPQVIKMLRTTGLDVQKPDKENFTWMVEF